MKQYKKRRVCGTTIHIKNDPFYDKSDPVRQFEQQNDPAQ